MDPKAAHTSQYNHWKAYNTLINCCLWTSKSISLSKLTILASDYHVTFLNHLTTMV